MSGRREAIARAEALVREAGGRPLRVEIDSLPGRDFWIVANDAGDAYRPTTVYVGEGGEFTGPVARDDGWGGLVEQIEHEVASKWPRLDAIPKGLAEKWRAACREVVGGFPVTMPDGTRVPPDVATGKEWIWPTEGYVFHFAEV